MKQGLDESEKEKMKTMLLQKSTTRLRTGLLSSELCFYHCCFYNALCMIMVGENFIHFCSRLSYLWKLVSNIGLIGLIEE